MYNHPSGEFVFAIFAALPVFLGTVSFRALSGGIGAEFSGGNFWQGAVTGGIVAGLNHAMHKMGGEDPRKPIKKIKKFPKFKIIKDNYPKDNPDGSHAHPSKDGYKNQCAIRVGVCIEKIRSRYFII